MATGWSHFGSTFFSQCNIPGTNNLLSSPNRFWGKFQILFAYCFLSFSFQYLSLNIHWEVLGASRIWEHTLKILKWTRMAIPFWVRIYAICFLSEMYFLFSFTINDWITTSNLVMENPLQHWVIEWNLHSQIKYQYTAESSFFLTASYYA